MEDMDDREFGYMLMTEAELLERVIEAGVSEEAKSIIEKRLKIIAEVLRG